jgi:RNase P subunit RPR2
MIFCPNCFSPLTRKHSHAEIIFQEGVFCCERCGFIGRNGITLLNPVNDCGERTSNIYLS